MGLLSRNPLDLLYFIPIFLITIVVHECAHGYVAWRLGDPTARAMGRLSLNPLRHIDPFGFIMLLIVGFGWAKPVQINPNNFRNPRAGMAISALAGPVSNLLMCAAGVIILNIIMIIANATATYNSIVYAALDFFMYFSMLNVYFAVFNLIPIPPLDGSRIAGYFLPPKLYYYYSYVERYGFIILMVLMYTGLLRGPLKVASDTIFGWILTAIGWIFGLIGG